MCGKAGGDAWRSMCRRWIESASRPSRETRGNGTVLVDWRVLPCLQVAEVSKKANLAYRAAEKRAAREEDARRIAEGVPPEVIQLENSAFPPGYFSFDSISNYAEVIGK